MNLSRPVFVSGEDGVVPTLDNCLGYYNALDEKGNVVGPLVGYAGTYEDADGKKKSFVGHEFYNFAMAEQWPFILDRWAENLLYGPMLELFYAGEITAFMGAPMGGLAFAQSLSRAYGRNARYIYPEKEVIKLKTSSSREESELLMNRHVLLPGDQCVEVEDVVNNFSTSDKIDELVEKCSADFIFIATILNRSEKSEFVTKTGKTLIVASVCHLPTKQYRQDNPLVADQIAKGNIAWKPKDVWFEKFIPLILQKKGQIE